MSTCIYDRQESEQTRAHHQWYHCYRGVDGKRPNASTESWFSIFRNCHLEVSRGFNYQYIPVWSVVLDGWSVVRTYWTTPLRSHRYWKRREVQLEKKRHEYLEQHAEYNDPYIPSEMQLRKNMKEGSVSMCPSCNGHVHDTVNKIHWYAVTGDSAVCRMSEK